MINRSIFLNLATFTLFGFGALGWILINWLFDYNLAYTLAGSTNIFLQALIGLGYGLIAALLAWLIISAKQLTPVRHFYGGLIQQVQLTRTDIIYVSVCAGIGEEILFRGALQPLMGIWITSVFFVLIHGYLNPKNIHLFFYGLYMVLAIAGLGYMAQYLGLISSIWAHIVIDIILLYKLSYTELPSQENESQEVINEE